MLTNHSTGCGDTTAAPVSSGVGPVEAAQIVGAMDMNICADGDAQMAPADVALIEE